MNCSKCGDPKTINEMAKHIDGKHKTICKLCFNAYQRERYAKAIEMPTQSTSCGKCGKASIRPICKECV